MAETTKGVLFFDKAKRRWQVEFFNAKKNKQSTVDCDKAQISADMPSNEDEKIEVEFERDSRYGNPLKVRLAGQEYKLPAAAIAQPKEQTLPYEAARGRERERQQRDPHDRERGRNRNQPQEAEDMLKREFHNPYNFIPAPERKDITSELCDRTPSGHDCYHSHLFSGKLRVKLTVETPLLIPDTARVTEKNYGKKEDQIHKSFPLRIGIDGRPHLAETSLKGMLRSAYEAITNSRMSVFTKHNERLGFRMESTEGAMMVPVRIEGEPGKEKINFYAGTSELYKDGRPFNEDKETNDKGEPKNGLLCAAWLPTYYECKVSKFAVKQLDKNKMPEHKQEAFAWLEKFQHYSWHKRHQKYIKDFQFWQVHCLASDEVKLGHAPEKTEPVPVPIERKGNSFRSSLGESLIKTKGYVCITGKNSDDYKQSGANIENKHDERFFFNRNANTEYPSVELTMPLRDGWERLIKDYRQEHDNGQGKLKDPPKAKKKGKDIELKWSRQIRNTTPDELKEKTELRKEKLEDKALCYARVEKDADGYKVIELYPVIISRRLHKLPPFDLMPPSLHPAKERNKLSPADRVFGWVNQNGEGAYRGQLRIGTIQCSTPKEQAIKYLNEDVNLQDKELGLPLSILGAPKPQQGRFYVAEDKHGKAQPNGRNNKEAGYDHEGKSLRGRKVYPHHANLPDDYWLDPTNRSLEISQESQGFYKEYRRRRGKDETGQFKEQRDNQNRSVQAWVESGTTFEFDIHFTNLSDVELGALLWLLNLNGNHFFRLGGGKPLGFGSVSLKLEGCDARDGAAWREYYESLVVGDEPDYRASETFTVTDAGNQDKANSEKVVKAYKDGLLKAYPDGAQSFEQISFIAAFLKSATGFVETGLPIHYPRARHEQSSDPVPPHEDGLAYEWFVENAKKPNRDNAKTQIILSDLVDEKGESDKGLPILFHKPKWSG